MKTLYLFLNFRNFLLALFSFSVQNLTQQQYIKDVLVKFFWHLLFSVNFTIERWRVSDARNVKELGGHWLRFEENMPGRTPKSE